MNEPIAQLARQVDEAGGVDKWLATRRAHPADFHDHRQGQKCEACRVASCRALGLDPADPLAFLTRPVVRFWTIVAGAVVSVLLIVQGK